LGWAIRILDQALETEQKLALYSKIDLDSKYFSFDGIPFEEEVGRWSCSGYLNYLQ
jgi:hypothetical protein